jgi:hypothetical protein
MGCDAVYVCISVYQLVGSRIISWGRCYDFLDIFAEKIGKKLAFLAQNKGKLCKILIITLVFRLKSSKIAENCDHNIDPWFSMGCAAVYMQIIESVSESYLLNLQL